MATTAPFGITPPSSQAPSTNIADYVSLAQQTMQATGQTDATAGVASALTNQANTVQSDTTKTVAALTNTQSQLSKTYGDLSDEFKVEESQAQSEEQLTGSANIGAAQVAQARSGVDTAAGGAFAAPVTAATQEMQSKIQDISDQYGAKQQDVTDALASNLDQIATQIVQAQSSGDEQAAALLTSVAQVKQQQATDQATLAEQMEASSITAYQDAWKDYNDEVNAAKDSETLDATLAKETQTAAYEQGELQIDQEKVDATSAKTSETANNDLTKAIQSAFGTVASGNKAGSTITSSEATDLANTLFQQFGVSNPGDLAPGEEGPASANTGTGTGGITKQQILNEISSYYNVQG